MPAILFRLTPEAMSATRRNGRVVLDINDAFAGIIGHEPQDIVDRGTDRMQPGAEPKGPDVNALCQISTVSRGRIWLDASYCNVQGRIWSS